MNRNLIASFILAGSIAALGTLQANAQSPDPALLAPGSSRLMLMPRPSIPTVSLAPRPTGASRAEVIPRSSGLASQSHASPSHGRR
jgi:hypothetical protein